LQPAAALDTLTLAGGAIATSGIGKRWWLRNGEVRHHLIDPRTGQPADNNLLSVTVRAPSAVEADIAAKTAFILGEDAAWPWLDARELTALFVYRDGAKVSNLREADAPVSLM
jgi:thiamine biosynthesis lipoprotein